MRIVPYVPFNKLRPALDGITVFSLLETIGADLIHAFNRVPLNQTPFVIGFESHLPRVFGLEGTRYEGFLIGQLASQRCRRIIAISHYAAENFRRFLDQYRHLDPEGRAALTGKLEVRYPNLPVAGDWGEEMAADGQLVVTFVGNHFARKGGCAVARMADLCLRRNLPVRFNIVSTLQCGGGIWTDPSNPGVYDPYFKLLALPNVSVHSNLPNEAVRGMLRQSHFTVLATLADTFGYSVLESMAVGTPAIATAQAALPEVIDDRINGELLDPALTPGQPGWIWDYGDRGSPAFERLFVAETERLAAEAVERLVRLLDSPADYHSMRQAAHRTMLLKHNSLDAGRYWDRLYVEALGKPAELYTGTAREGRAS